MAGLTNFNLPFAFVFSEKRAVIGVHVVVMLILNVMIMMNTTNMITGSRKREFHLGC